jgi:hypothetical protein
LFSFRFFFTACPSLIKATLTSIPVFALVNLFGLCAAQVPPLAIRDYIFRLRMAMILSPALIEASYSPLYFSHLQKVLLA